MISLRPYQQTAVDALRASFRSGKRAPLFQLPTGGGKTFVFSYVADGATKLRNRVLILVHRKELLTQASMSLAKIGLRHSLIAQDKHIRESIGLHVEELSAPFVDLAAPVAVASVDTLIRRLGTVKPPQLIICDEAHHLTKGNKWGKAVAHFPDALGVVSRAKGMTQIAQQAGLGRESLYKALRRDGNAAREIGRFVTLSPLCPIVCDAVYYMRNTQT
ncbi:MAG: DEAD/DEAH box helicase family protein [Novosphingobium sp.]